MRNCDLTTNQPISPQMVVKSKGNPRLFSGKSRLVKYYSIWPDCRSFCLLIFLDLGKCLPSYLFFEQIALRRTKKDLRFWLVIRKTSP